MPPKRSWASNAELCEVKVSRAPKPRDSDDGDGDAEPDGREPVAVSGLDQVGDQDADDEGGLEALTQADQVVREHGVPSADQVRQPLPKQMDAE